MTNVDLSKPATVTWHAAPGTPGTNEGENALEFDTLAEALRFAMEDIDPGNRASAAIDHEGGRLAHDEIETLYRERASRNAG